MFFPSALPRSVLTLPLVAFLLTACGMMGPATGWVSNDKTKGTGVYVWSNGQRYEGQVANDKFQGVGTLVYPENLPYEIERDWPSVLGGSALTLNWANDKYSAEKARLVNKRFTYEGGWSGGTKGKGILTLKDGRRLEGEFSNEPTLFLWFPRKGADFKFDTNTIIGSKLSGDARVTWPDGSHFEGKLLDYHLFPRSGMDVSCTAAAIMGAGRLTTPGKAEYVGPIVQYEWSAESRPTPATMSDLESYAMEIAECQSKLAADRDKQLNYARKRDAEMEQARREAKAWLHNEIAKMPAQKAREMERVGMASRGTTPEIEAEKARRNAEFQAAIDKARADSASSSGDRSSSQNGKKSGTDSPSNSKASNPEKTSYTEKDHAKNKCGFFLNPDVFTGKRRAEVIEQNAREAAQGKVRCEHRNTAPSHNTSK